MRFTRMQRQSWSIEVDNLLVVQAIEKGSVTPARIGDGEILFACQLEQRIVRSDSPPRYPSPSHSTNDPHPLEGAVPHLLDDVSSLQ